MSAMATTLLKTLTMATKLTLPPHFTSHSHHLSLPFTPIKPPFTLSLSYPSKFTTFVAKTTPHWDPQHQQDTAFSLESGTHQHHVDDGYGGGDVESESQRFDLGGGEYVSPTEKDISFALGSGTHHHDDGDGDGASDSQRLDLGGGDYVGPTESETEIVKLFVGNLSYDVDHDELAQVFEAAGEVQFAEVIYNRDTKASRGFGFVTMSTIEEVERAEEMFNGKELRGRLLVVNKAAPKGSRLEKPPREYKPSFRIYVGNLPWNVDNVRLEQEFSKYGEVIRAWVLSDKETGRSRGFGFVTMASEAGMNDAIAALDGQTLDGRTIRVDVAEDRPRF